MRLGHLAAATIVATLSASALPSSAAVPAPTVRLAVPGSQLAGARPLGEYRPTSDLSIMVGLTPRQPHELDALATSINSPNSPQYGRRLSRSEFLERFAPLPSAVEATRAWLESAGLRVSAVAPDRLFLLAQAPAPVVERALHTQLQRYRFASGELGWAAAMPAMIPARLAGTVNAIGGLDSREVGVSSLVRPSAALVGQYPERDDCHQLSPTVRQTETIHCHTPAEIAATYDAPGAAVSGGAGQRIAVLSAYAWEPSSLRLFESRYGLPAAAVNVSTPGGAPDSATASDETELDVQWASAMAPSATIDLVLAPDNTLNSLVAGLEAWVNDGTPIASTSWGTCESVYAAQGLSSVAHSILARAATLGMTLFAAAGDWGGSCPIGLAGSPEPALLPGVLYPASDPVVTAVGGTTLFSAAGGGYVDETAWGSDQAGGGGLSALFARPPWQTPNPATLRAVPDVSLAADPLTGYAFYDISGTLAEVGGTSAGAPAWAGLYALQSAYDRAAGRTPGTLNPLLYAAVAGGLPGPAGTGGGLGHDVVQGTNWTYPATAGYDLATGLGTPDLRHLLPRLLPPS